FFFQAEDGIRDLIVTGVQTCALPISLYLKLGCVRKLMAHLNGENVKTKTWVTKAGTRLGGVSFARGHLYYLLRNRLYIGEIRHRDRKSTRLNSSHDQISYAVFCLKKK